MSESSAHDVTFKLSASMSDRLQSIAVATGLDVSTVVDHALAIFFDDQPDAAIVQHIRALAEAARDGSSGDIDAD